MGQFFPRQPSRRCFLVSESRKTMLARQCLFPTFCSRWSQFISLRRDKRVRIGNPAGEKGVLCLAGNSASYVAIVLCRSRMTPSRHHLLNNRSALLRQVAAGFRPSPVMWRARLKPSRIIAGTRLRLGIRTMLMQMIRLANTRSSGSIRLGSLLV